MLATGALALCGCDAPEQTASSGGTSEQPGNVAPSGLPTAPMTIGGEDFTIELAYEDESIIKGMGGRTSIDPRGGMLFIFPSPSYKQFVMRDCLTPIDIAFLDSRGVVLTTYTMGIEPPKRAEESDAMYESRLQKYPSRYRALFVLETAAGTWDALGVQEGDRIGFDVEALKKLAF